MRKLPTWMKIPLRLFPVFVLLLVNTALPLAAQSPTSTLTAIQVTTTSDGVHLEWGNTASDSAVAAAAALKNLPTMHFQGYDLPMQLITVQLPAQASTIQIDQLASTNWQGNLTPSGPLQPPALDWQDNTDLKPQEKAELPASPIFILRQGKIHGQRIAIVAISPLYQKNGVVQLATTLKARAVGAIQRADNVADLLKSLAAEAGPSVEAASMATGNLAPTNSVAAGAAIKLIVSKNGLQSLNAQALTNAGLNPSTVDLTKLHLYHNGKEVPLDISQSPDLDVRFYAPTVGDRWNLTDMYWLTVETGNGLRMTGRDVTPGNAITTPTAFEKGVWAENINYQSRQAGADGDHWFNATMEIAPAQVGNPASYPTATISLDNSILPLAAGTSSYTFTLSTYYKAIYILQADLGGATQKLTWNSAPNGLLVQDWAIPLTTTTSSTQIQLTLVPTDSVEGLNLDRMFWQRPVTLNFQNKGATFSGTSGVWLYAWQNAPLSNNQYLLYDITDPDAPVRLTGVSGAGFQDGPTPHDYVVSGPGSLQTPQALAHTGFAFSASAGADAIYIVPNKNFITALDPLLTYRRAQGYTVTTVDVQDIYDAWSFGQVSAPAIRSFLRFAKANWNPSPISVVLVGDATWDPHNYLNLGANNVDLMPAYMADVDPWLGETACENCFVQLDGDDPVTGDNPGSFFKADMWIGRFPVKTIDELSNVVKKMLHYEQDANLGSWRGTAVFLADNYIRSLDANNKPVIDPAGDFAAVSNDSANFLLYPPAPNQDQNNPNYGYIDSKGIKHYYDKSKFGYAIKRVYYDPYPQISDPQGVEPWRVADANTTWSKVMEALNAGAGLVTYNGHSHHWQWGSTDVNAAKSYLISLYDTDLLTNVDALFIDLSMTCYTSQFTKAASSGTVLDERMFLNPRGGAVAIWGPAGLSVAHGHDSLQRGFYTKLWASEPMKARMGELLEAGYTELLTKSTCCQDALQTFLLMGDPLTPARVMAQGALYLPIVTRSK